MCQDFFVQICVLPESTKVKLYIHLPTWFILNRCYAICKLEICVLLLCVPDSFIGRSGDFGIELGASAHSLLPIDSVSPANIQSSSHTHVQAIISPEDTVNQNQAMAIVEAASTLHMKTLAEKYHVMVTLLIWSTTVGLAVSFQDVSIVLEFSGIMHHMLHTCILTHILTS